LSIYIVIELWGKVETRAGKRALVLIRVSKRGISLMSRNAQGNRNNLEFKVKKKDSYKLQSYKNGRASAALNLIRTTLVKAPALSHLRSNNLELHT
jgi:hypothetical protein